MSDPVAESTVAEITVNGRAVPAQLFAALLEDHPARDEDEQAALQEVGTALVIRELLLQHAEQQGLATDTGELDEQAVDELIDRVLEREVPVKEAADDEIERYYAANRARFVTPPLIEMRHILRACAPDDAAGRQQARMEVSSLLGQLAQGADFGGLATAHSDCPSREQGGALGQISAGQTVPEFEQQVFPLGEGLCPDAIETRFGYHIVMIDQRVDGQPVEFRDAREQIRHYLRDAGRHQAIRHFLQQLGAAAEIQGIELDLQEDQNLLQ